MNVGDYAKVRWWLFYPLLIVHSGVVTDVYPDGMFVIDNQFAYLPYESKLFNFIPKGQIRENT